MAGEHIVPARITLTDSVMEHDIPVVPQAAAAARQMADHSGKQGVFTVDTAKATGTPRDDQGQIPKACQGTSELAPVFANFRQYLMGWDTESRPGSNLDQFRSGLAAPQFNGAVRIRSTSAIGQAVATVRRDLAGLPWWWWVGSDSPEDTAGALKRHGGRELAVLPVMVRSLAQPADPGGAPAPADPDHVRAGLRVETVRDEEQSAWPLWQTAESPGQRW
ncbi:hypothetical protein [Streptomyces sp. NPDC059639]|uniref:hypothetical protein n=1 Tax=Streptomyces sp. NPDC059639 TaxID=3346891 RepID=UPI0036BAF7B0